MILADDEKSFARSAAGCGIKAVLNGCFVLIKPVPAADRSDEGGITDHVDDILDRLFFFRNGRCEEIAIDIGLDGKALHEDIKIVQLETLFTRTAINDHPGAGAGTMYQVCQYAAAYRIDDGIDTLVPGYSPCFCLDRVAA